MRKNVSKFKQFLSLTVILALMAPAMVNAQAGKANFAGTWTMNAEKSTVPEGGRGNRMGGGEFTVTQDAATMSQSRAGRDGATMVTKYTLDGKETVNTFGQGESKSTATWSADGKKLTIVTKMNFNGNDRTTSATWSLIDAKTLQIESKRQGQDGEVVTKMVYDKK